MKQMTKKEAVELMAHVILISTTENANDELEAIITRDQLDKMMRVIVHLFKNDSKKAEAFVRSQTKKLIAKLDAHDDSDCKDSTFIKGDKKVE